MTHHSGQQIIKYCTFHLTAVKPITILVNVCLKVIYRMMDTSKPRLEHHNYGSSYPSFHSRFELSDSIHSLRACIPSICRFLY